MPQTNPKFYDPDYTENCYLLSGIQPFSFCGSINCKYDLYYDVCTWALLAIREVSLNRPDPPQETWSKGTAYGINIWDVLQSSIDVHSFTNIYKEGDKIPSFYWSC